ncbi:MAG: galactokinase [Bacteroidales bacterium]|nr:galactokinase [Bacteroidales bacterium]
MDLQLIRNAFADRFDGESTLFNAPGRINLIGEHTDYNGGFVFPGAVSQSITAAVRPNGSRTVHAVALDLGIDDTFNIDDERGPESVHLRYLFGVVREIMKLGVAVEGFDIVYGGDIPLGAGMSSSAALESCVATALNTLFADGRIDKMTLARVGQATEHNYVGVKCGIMDQFASMHGRAGQLMRLDCRSGEFAYYPWKPNGYSLVLINSCVKHELVGSPYNDRRNSCEHVATLVGVETLRDCSWQQLEAVRDQLSDEDYRRARYVLGEKERVLAVCDALEQGDYTTVGQQMYGTHLGLRNDYEVSCEEIDFLVDKAHQHLVTGARLMGGGFGGCAIILVADSQKEAFLTDTAKAYENRFGRQCQIIPVTIGDGAKKL